MIEPNCVLVGPFQPMIDQRLAKKIESHNIVGTEGIPRNQELYDERDPRGNKNGMPANGRSDRGPSSAQIDRYFTRNGERCSHD